MNCPRCKHEIHEEDQFCSNCGLKLQRCSHCHHALMENAQFCTHCGMSVKEEKEDYVGGYYQPIQENEFVKEEPKDQGDFKNISVNKKVNKPLIIISVVVIIIATVLSYQYLSNSKPVQSPDTLVYQSFQVEGEMSPTAVIGNINQEGHVGMHKDTLYIVNNKGQLMSMNRQIGNQKVIINDVVSYVNIVGETIYYTNKDHHICSSDLNGQNQKVILDKEAYYMTVKDQKIYYQLDKDNESIYVYDLSTHQNQKLNKRRSYNLNIIGEKIYYTSEDGIYSIGIDGKGDEKLVGGNPTQLIYQNEKLYFTAESAQVQCFDLKTKQITNVVDGVSMLANMTEDYLFYYTRKGIHRYDLKTKETRLIYNESLTYCEVIGDKLVLTFNDSYQQPARVIMDFDGKNPQRLFVEQEGDFV